MHTKQIGRLSPSLFVLIPIIPSLSILPAGRTPVADGRTDGLALSIGIQVLVIGHLRVAAQIILRRARTGTDQITRRRRLARTVPRGSRLSPRLCTRVPHRLQNAELSTSPSMLHRCGSKHGHVFRMKCLCLSFHIYTVICDQMILNVMPYD